VFEIGPSASDGGEFEDDSLPGYAEVDRRFRGAYCPHNFRDNGSGKHL
jgi:hypothetical protein